MTTEELKCPICGKPTNVWYGNARKDRLCREHAQQLKNGQIEQCPDCGKWHETGKLCDCKRENNTPTENNISSELTCIICGKPSNGKHFCINCYKKYANKILYLKVSKCKDFEKLDAEYESDFACDDGHLVKSLSEKTIDDWLYKEKIQHGYEVKLPISKDKHITPDFYIPEYNGIKNIYLEFWGFDETNIKYQEQKEYKHKIYTQLTAERGYTVIYLNKEDLKTNGLKQKLDFAEQGKINE